MKIMRRFENLNSIPDSKAIVQKSSPHILFLGLKRKIAVASNSKLSSNQLVYIIPRHRETKILRKHTANISIVLTTVNDNVMFLYTAKISTAKTTSFHCVHFPTVVSLHILQPSSVYSGSLQ